MTSRCSMLPCSRSRSTAAPVRKIASTEMLLMIWLMATNQPCCMLGLKRARVSSCDQRRVAALGPALPEGLDRAGDDVLDVARSAAGLAHGRGVGDDLDGRLGVPRQVLLEFRRQVHHEGVLPGIHVAIDVAERDVGGRQEQRRQHGVLHRSRAAWESSSLTIAIEALTTSITALFAGV